jgi:hypothetical protein
MPSKGSIPRICEQCGASFGVDSCVVRKGYGRFCSHSCARRGQTQTPALERFWRSVDKSPSGCWLWTATKTTFGYGVFWADGRLHKAHRWSYELLRGPIPKGLHALHHCDTPACVNPEHLFLGTQADNVADMRAKGRGFDIPPEKAPHGERNGHARLTAELVLAIRAACAGDDLHREIAARFGVSAGQVSHIARGGSWRHLLAEGNPGTQSRKGRAPRGEHHHAARLTEADVRAIRARRAAGETGVALARAYGVTPTLISAIIKRRCWRHIE